VRVAFHADDLGFSPSINDGIFDALRRGVLTGASVLSNAPKASEALAEWKAIDAERRGGTLPSLVARKQLDDLEKPFDLGVHLNLSQGRPLSDAKFPGSMLDDEGCFRGLRSLMRLLSPDASRYAHVICLELSAQIEFVLDHSIRPVRLDGHQYCELVPVVGHIVHQLAERYDINAVRVAREPGVLGALVQSHGLYAVSLCPSTIATQCFAVAYASRSRRAGLHHPQLFFGTVTAGRVGRREIERFVSVAIHKCTALAEIGLHPAKQTAGNASSNRTSKSDLAWHDPLSDLRPSELEWLVDAGFPAWLGDRGICLGRVS